MRKIVHLDTVQETYAADAAVLTCFDARFRNVCCKLLKRLGVAQPDLISTREAPRRSLLQQMGAYGGLQAFAGGAEDEVEHHGNELRRAAETVRSLMPERRVDTYFLNFEGAWEVEAAEGAPVA